MIWSILHSVLQVWLLAGLLSVFITTLMLWRRVRRRMKSYYSPSAPILSVFDGSPASHHIHTIDRISHYWPMILVVLTGLSFGLNIWLMQREFSRQNFVELKNIRVLNRMDSFLFRMDSEDPDTHQRHPFMIRFCPDYEPTREMQAGVTLTLLKYERHDFDGCASIGKRSLGYILERSQDGKPITFNAGHPATGAAEETD